MSLSRFSGLEANSNFCTPLLMDETIATKRGAELRPDDIDLAFHGSDEARRRLAVTLWSVVERAVQQTVRPIARALGRDIGQEIEEFVQETWILLLKDEGRVLRMWDPARGRSLNSWVHLVAQRHILRTLKGHRKNPWANHSLPLHEIVALIDDGLPLRHDLVSDLDRIVDLMTLLDAVRAELGEARWSIFRQIFIEQRAPAEIAAEARLGVSQIYDLASYFRRQVRSIAKSLDSPLLSPAPPAQPSPRDREKLCMSP
ncbi:sigma factor [Nannocystis pusilla]|uniref:RNA polymerase sigma-70 region 2 domain-containing protein n=1 Tax=Nannocystis pusilla TaxID=889268 RepID=A0ABS7TVE4_9BACT|nr:sigma factor [Nannocystis pusilla]MBZ5712243.1 hypothetical protein [Nannocystis pusilla]